MMADRYWLAKFAERRDPLSELAPLFLGLIPRSLLNPADAPVTSSTA